MDKKTKAKTKRRSRLRKAWGRLVRRVEQRIGPVLTIPAVQRVLGLMALVAGFALMAIGLGPMGFALVLVGAAFLLAFWSQTR